MDFQNHFHTRLEALKSEGNYRVFADIERRKGCFPTAGRHADGEVTDVTVWCSNDYLGMSQHPQVVQAMIDTVEACGTGAGGTRNISGNTIHHLELEQELAALHGKEAALLFTSGYVSNWASLSTLGAQIPNGGCLRSSRRGCPHPTGSLHPVSAPPASTAMPGWTPSPMVNSSAACLPCRHASSCSSSR